MYEDSTNITQFFISLIDEHRSLDVAEAEFKRIVADDPELQADYRTWCEENSLSERHGFSDFGEEYLANRESVWDVLDEYSDDGGM